jgi:hypothetical protein
MPVPDFSPGEVLTAAAMDSIGLWKVGQFTASGTSRALVCDNIFTSNYTAYKVVVGLGSTSNTNWLYFQGINTAGATVTTGYGSSCYVRDYFTGTTGVTVFGSLGNTLASLGPIANAVGNSSSVEFNILNPATSGQWWRGNGQMTGIYSGVAYGAGELYFSNTSGNLLRGLRFDNANGTNLTGTVTVYGFRN